MHALISPLEPRHGGFRVADVAEQPFEVADPFFWVKCAASVQADTHYYDPSDATIKTSPSPIVTPKVISSVTMRQARKALLRAGKLAQVESAIASMTGDAGAEARIEWEYSNEVLRDQPLTQSLAAALGMTDQEMDDLFTTASTL